MIVETMPRIWTRKDAGLALEASRDTIRDLINSHPDEIELFEIPTRPSVKGVNSQGMAVLARLLNRQWPPKSVA